MSTFKTTWIFAVVVATITGFAVYEFNKGKAKEDAAANSFLEKVDIGAITAIRQNAQGVEFQLEKKEGEWRVIKPYEDLASDEMVDSFLRLIRDQKMEEVEKPEGEALNLERFGLQNPSQIVITQAAQPDITFHVGSVRTFDNGFYVRPNSEQNVFVGSSTWENILNKDPEDFRDKSLRLPSKDLIKIKLTTKGEGQRLNYELHKKDGQWVVTYDEKIRIDQNQVTKLISDLRNLSAESAVVSNPGPKSEASPNLQSPDMSFALTYADDSRVEIKSKREKAGKNKTPEIFLSSTTVPVIYKISEGSLNKINKSSEELRDKNYMFSAPLNEAATIEISKSSGSSLEKFEKKNDQWTYAQNSNAKVDTAQLESFLSALGALKADDFLGQAKSDLKNRVSVLNKEGAPLLEIKFDDGFKTAKGTESYKVRTSLSDEVVVVSKSALESVVNKKLLAEEPKKAADAPVQQVKSENDKN